MNPFQRLVAGLSAVAVVIGIVFIWEAPNSIDPNQANVRIANSETPKAGPVNLETTHRTAAIVELSPVQLLDPYIWTDAETLQSELIPIEGDPNLFERRRIVRSQDFDSPVLLVETLLVDPVSGEVSEELHDSMIANQLVVSSPSTIDEELLKERLASTVWSIERLSHNGLISVLQSQNLQLNSVSDGLSLLKDLLHQSPELIVEPNRIYYAAIKEPNDPLYTDQKLWGLHNAQDIDVDAPEGWEIRTDASDVTIAILDTGIREDHLDLVDNLWKNSGEIPNNGIDDDDNGYVDDLFGVNVIDPNLSATDDSGHGTHVAGVAGASGNNDLGVSGIAWRTKLMAVKFMNASGRGTLENAVESMDYAVENGADIINASWGSRGESPSLELAMERALNAGVFIVASAGNENENIDNTYFHPASSPLPNVITVASIDQSGDRSGNSNYGIGSTDLAAPGSNILSTSHLSSTSYSLESGTSMAAPFVSGILALNLSLRPDDDLQTHVDRLIVSSKLRPTLTDVSRSRGMVSLERSLSMETVPYPPVIESHSELKTFVVAGKDVTFSVVATSKTPVTFEWYFGESLLENETSAELLLESISESNQGVYRFVATNEDGEASIEFELNVLTPDPDLAEGLDAGPSTLVFTPNDDLWTITSDPLSREGDHVEGRYPPNKYHTNTLTAIVRGPGDLQFLWKLAGVVGNTNRPEFYVDGKEVSIRTSQDEWRVGEYRLEEDRDYKITWSFWNSTTANTANGKLIIDYLKVFPIGQVPPLIYRHPSDNTIKPFDLVYLHASALGHDLSFQWFHNGDPIPDSDGSQISVRNASPDDEGDYHVVVSNPHGSDTSLPGRLEVDESQTPARFLEPSGELDGYYKGIAGNSLDITRAHVGSPPLTYRWYKNGVLIPGQNGPVLSFNPLRKEHAGGYDLHISNPYESRTQSASIGVDVVDKDLSPVAVVGERDIYPFRMEEGYDFDTDYWMENEFEPLEFQWYKNGIPLEGQTSLRLKIESATYADSGIYSLEFKNDFGIFRDDVYVLAVNFSYDEALEIASSEWLSQDIEDRGWINTQRQISYDGEDALEFARKPPFKGPSYYDDGGFTAFTGRRFKGPTNVSFYWKRSSEDGHFQTYVGTAGHQELPPTQTTRLIESGPIGSWQKSVVHIPEGEHYLYVGFVGQIPEVIGWLDQMEISTAPAITTRIPDAIISGTESITVESSAWGSGTISYQWFRNKIPIPGETSASIFIETGSTTPEDRFYVTAKSEFGTTRSTEFQIVPIDSMMAASGQEITVGGTVYWERNPWNPTGLVTSVGPEDIGWIEIALNGPLVISYEGSDFDMYLNDSPLELLNWTGPFSSYRKYAHIPSGPHNLRIERSGWPDSERIYTQYLHNLQVSDSPLIINEDLSLFRDNPISFYLAETAVYFAAKLPATIRWYKDDELVKESTAEESGKTLFFEQWWDSSRDISHVGTYYCEIVDADGNIGKSDEMVVKETDTLEFGEIVGDATFELSTHTHSFIADPDVFIEGNASARTTIQQGGDRAYFQIYNSAHIDGAYTTYELKVKLSGFDDQTLLTIINDHQFKTELVPTGEWQSITVSGKTGSIDFNIAKAESSTIDLWIDDMKSESDTSLQIVQHPDHYATYVGGRASFSVEAFSSNPITYQWRRNGINLPGEKSANLVINSITEEDLGDYDVELNSQGKQVISDTGTLSVVKDLGAALEMPGMKVSTWGDALWEIDRSVSIDGTSSLRSGDVEPGEFSTLRIEFDFPGMYSIYAAIEHFGAKKLHWGSGSEAWEGASYFVDYTLRREEASYPYAHKRYMRLDRLSFSPLSLQSYTQWLNNSPDLTNAANRSDSLFDQLEDSDGDNIANFLEYLFDLDPLGPSQLPTVSFDHADGQQQALMDYRFAATGEFVIKFETSNNLKDWNLVHPKNLRTLDSSSSYFDIQSIIELPLSPSGAAFLRWTVLKTGPSGSPLGSN